MRTGESIPYLVDSHAHLDFSDFDRDREEVLKRAEEVGIKLIINIGFDESSSHKSMEFAEKYPMIYSAVGIHPHDAKNASSGYLKVLEKLTGHSKVVALGEMGLDFYRDRSPRDVQRKVFRQQMQLAHEVGLPIIVHSRDSHEEVVKILEEEGVPPAGGVMHCFSGDVALAKKVLEMNMAVSIAGPVTYRGSSKLAQVAAFVPQEWLLIETDCPFLAPAPKRGKRNEPAYVSHVARQVASLRGTTPEKIGKVCLENTARLFSIDVEL